MDFLEYDLTITDEQRELQQSAHKFAAEVLRPAGIELDRMTPEEVVAPESPLHGVYRQASELGYNRTLAPAELGGLGLDPLSRYLVSEELSWGSMGLGGVIFLASNCADVALAVANPAAIEEFTLPYYATTDGSVCGCWAITEPDHGSDTVSAVVPGMEVKTPGQITARKDGDDWILNGQKSAWVSNAPIATHAMVNVQIAGAKGFDECAVFLLPLDLPGVSKGPPLDKHGARSLPQGEIFFDDVRLPSRWMIVEPADYTASLQVHLTAFNAGVGCGTTGLARAAYECTLAYTKERIQGGKPIFEHQSVRARLFRMFSLVQACRTLSRGVYVYNMTRLERGEPAALHHSTASKVFCTNAALEVATLAVQLHGGNGMTKEYPVEMFLRDATSLTIADGENAMLAQIGASML
jgi:alkylation response protein AidB-like acyl-CoA dehydrogenase